MLAQFQIDERYGSSICEQPPQVRRADIRRLMASVQRNIQRGVATEAGRCGLRRRHSLTSWFFPEKAELEFVMRCLLRILIQPLILSPINMFPDWRQVTSCLIDFLFIQREKGLFVQCLIAAVELLKVMYNVLVLNSVTLRVQTMVRKEHITVETTMGFSETSRNLMSTSMDSSARVTVITETKNNGFNMWIIFFFIMLAVAAYILKNSGKIHEETRSRILSHFRN